MRGQPAMLTFLAVCALLGCCGAASPLLQACNGILEKSWDFTSTLPYCTDVATAIQSGSRSTFNGPLLLSNCRLQWFEQEEVCGVMRNTFPHVIFEGSSLMRHMNNGFNILLTGNAVNSTHRPNSNPIESQDCTCELQFNDGHIVDDEGIVHGNSAAQNIMKCRDLTLSDSDELATPVCPGQDIHTHFAWTMEKSRSNRTLYVLGGQGLHTDFNLTKFEDDYVKPAIKIASRERGDAIICVTTHSQGPNRPVKYISKQGNPNVIIYNAGLRSLCERHGFPVLDFFHVTKNTTTWDGIHFGLAPNVLKAQILLNWMKNHQVT